MVKTSLHKKSTISQKNTLTRFMSFRPSSNLQFLFFSLCASSIITHLHSIALSSGQPPRIISNVVIMALNLYVPRITRPWKVIQVFIIIHYFLPINFINQNKIQIYENLRVCSQQPILALKSGSMAFQISEEPQ